MTNAIAAPKLYAAVKGRALPSSVVKEILMGLTVGLCVGGVWKTYHWNERRKAQEYYQGLEKATK